MGNEYTRAARARLTEIEREVEALEPEAPQYHEHLLGFLMRFEADYPEGAQLAITQLALQREIGKRNTIPSRRK